jgi:hypothetical protein
MTGINLQDEFADVVTTAAACAWLSSDAPTTAESSAPPP